jgi:hypothetical protein
MSARVSRRIPKSLICIGAALLLVAIVAALWPRSVTYGGVRRTCSPQLGDFAPADPGPRYPVGLVDECGRRQQPERITMLVCGPGRRRYWTCRAQSQPTARKALDTTTQLANPASRLASDRRMVPPAGLAVAAS